MCHAAAPRRIVRDDLSGTAFRVPTGQVRRSHAEVTPPRLDRVTVPAAILFARSGRNAGFLDARLEKELEVLLVGNWADVMGKHLVRGGPRQTKDSKSARADLVTVPVPVQTRRPLRWVGFLDEETRRELENVSLEKDRNETHARAGPPSRGAAPADPCPAFRLLYHRWST